MIGNQWPYAIAALLFAAGMWQMLPRGHVHSRRPGIGLTAVGLALLVLLVHFGLIFTHAAPYVKVTADLPRLGGWIEDSVFLVLAGVTVVSAIGAVTMRSPVYCAIWFAMTLLGTAGLFFYQGAQFLGVATVVVYAGAILVTFLFVLMLANPEGFARYDRVSWEGMLSACAGAVMVGMLTMTTATALQPRDKAGVVEQTAWNTSHTTAEAAKKREANVLQDKHVARLGGELFSKQLIAVEVAGTLLMVALVVLWRLSRMARRSDARRRATAMDEVQLLYNYQVIGALLFGIGLVGFISRRNMIVMFLAAEMMLQGVSLSLVAWGRYYNNWDGQMLVIFILAVAACEAAIALALVLMLFQRSGNLDMTLWQGIREDNLQPFVDHEVPDDPHPRQKWPQLVPAGVEPEADEEETVHRTHV